MARVYLYENVTTPPPAANLDAANDIEKRPVDQVLTERGVQLGRGVNSAEAQQLFTKYGPNALLEKEILVLPSASAVLE